MITFRAEPPMHIGVAGPVSLSMLATHLPADASLPRGYPFPLIAQYVKGLLGRGHRVTVFTLCSETPSPLFIRGERLSVSITPQRARRWWLDGQEREVRDLREAMRAHPVEVMHAHWTYEFPRAAHWAGVPTLVTAHDSPWRILRMMWPTGGRWIRLSRQVHALRVLREAQALTVVSPYLEDELRRDFAITCPVTLVPNGLDAASMRTGPAKPGMRSEQPTLLAAFSGGFSGIKNGPLLLEACQRLHTEGKPFRLVLLGAGCEPGGDAERTFLARGCSFPIRFQGPQAHAEVLRLMREEADLYVHPSLEESFGMAILEAMAQGLPVVGGGASGAVPWLLGHGASGYLADMTSPQAVAECLAGALAAPEATAGKAAAALARVSEYFTLEGMVEGYERLLRDLNPVSG